MEKIRSYTISLSIITAVIAVAIFGCVSVPRAKQVFAESTIMPAFVYTNVAPSTNLNNHIPTWDVVSLGAGMSNVTFTIEFAQAVTSDINVDVYTNNTFRGSLTVLIGATSGSLYLPMVSAGGSATRYCAISPSNDATYVYSPSGEQVPYTRLDIVFPTAVEREIQVYNVNLATVVATVSLGATTASVTFPTSQIAYYHENAFELRKVIMRPFNKPIINVRRTYWGEYGDSSHVIRVSFAQAVDSNVRVFLYKDANVPELLSWCPVDVGNIYPSHLTNNGWQRSMPNNLTYADDWDFMVNGQKYGEIYVKWGVFSPNLTYAQIDAELAELQVQVHVGDNYVDVANFGAPKMVYDYTYTYSGNDEYHVVDYWASETKPAPPIINIPELFRSVVWSGAVPHNGIPTTVILFESDTSDGYVANQRRFYGDALVTKAIDVIDLDFYESIRENPNRRLRFEFWSNTAHEWVIFTVPLTNNQGYTVTDSGAIYTYDFTDYVFSFTIPREIGAYVTNEYLSLDQILLGSKDFDYSDPNMSATKPSRPNKGATVADTSPLQGETIGDIIMAIPQETYLAIGAGIFALILLFFLFGKKKKRRCR